MKVKHSPEDFIVEELTDVMPGEAGEFAFYKLEKTGWTTPDALAAIRRRWEIDNRRLYYGGLKDRHAKTTQYISIHRGPQRNLNHERIEVTYLGHIDQPYSSPMIRANRFAIVLRSLAETARLAKAAEEMAACGVPNYFDDQRFGSVGVDGRFIALEMIRGHFEESLKLALAAPYEHDRGPEKKEKAILRQHWNHWPECKAKLPRGHARSLVDYLVHHPTDFKGAVARLRPELGGLYLSAYQSHVWNRMLGRWLTSKLPAESLAAIELKLGSFPAPRVNLPEWERLQVPLPSARLKLLPDDPWLGIANDVLAEDGLTPEKMRIPGMEKPYFSKGDRAACLKPAYVSIDTDRDEKHAGRMKAILRFELPRGCYATMVIKRLTSSR